MEREIRKSEIYGLSHALSRLGRNKRVLNREVVRKLEKIRAEVCPSCRSKIESLIDSVREEVKG